MTICQAPSAYTRRIRSVANGQRRVAFPLGFTFPKVELFHSVIFHMKADCPPADILSLLHPSSLFKSTSVNMRLVSVAAWMGLLAAGAITGALAIDASQDADTIMGQLQVQAMDALNDMGQSSLKLETERSSLEKAHVRRDWQVHPLHHLASPCLLSI